MGKYATKAIVKRFEPEFIWNDDEIAQLMLTSDGLLLSTVPQDVLQKHREYYTIAVMNSAEPSLLEKVPREEQARDNFKLVFMAIKRSAMSYAYVDNAYKTMDFITQCVAINGEIYLRIDSKIIKNGGKELLQIALKTCPHAIEFQYFDPSMYAKSFSSNEGDEQEENCRQWKEDEAILLMAYQQATKIQSYIKREDAKARVMRTISRSRLWLNNALFRCKICAMDTTVEQVNMWKSLIVQHQQQQEQQLDKRKTHVTIVTKQ